jgi:hypothetical protein
MNTSEIANWTARFIEKQTWLGAAGGRRLRGGTDFSLWTSLSSFTSPGDLFKILIIGGALASIRRFFWKAWNALMSHFYLVATLEVNEPSYREYALCQMMLMRKLSTIFIEWMLVWLAQHQEWSKNWR